MALTVFNLLVKQQVALIGLAFARDRLEALMKLLGGLGLAECGGGQQSEDESQVRASGGKNAHAESLGAPGPFFKSLPLAVTGRRLWSATILPRSSRMSATRSCPW